MNPDVPGGLVRYKLPVGMMNVAEFIIHIESINANVNIPTIKRAFEFSNWAHRGQLRKSGEPYVEHCLNVAFILAQQHLDGDTIAAGLLHDVVEDTDVTVDDLEKEFSTEIAELVDGVTKLGHYSFKNVQESQAEYFRKMLMSMAQDIRIIIIKLADRLHNMRTLEYLPPKKQARIATETREIFAPLARRFGMAKIKWELEDLSLKTLHPDIYNKLVENIQHSRGEREKYISEITNALSEALEAEGLEVEISGRAKHFDSIYRKMIKRDLPFEQIYDLIAVRVLTDTVKDCYHALGVIHNFWTPVADRIHDYIATPKANMYQSLHTTVIGPHGRMVEIQMRTQAMHYVAEYGIAAHWLYKEGKHELDESDRQLSWLREVLEWQKEMQNPSDFLEHLKIDLFPDEVFVFTPGGALKHLQKGTTALDFAFAVHTDVGLHCSGTKVNSRLVPFETVLHSGDKVEVLTSTRCEPSRDWLKICQTSSAKAKIRKFLRQKGFDESLRLGKEMFDKLLKKKKLKSPSDQDILDAAMALSYTSTEQMFSAIGHGDLELNSFLKKLFPQEDTTPTKSSIIKQFVDRARSSKGIKIAGMGNMMFRFARCCQPVPGEKIIGFITRGRGISIHRANCSNAIIVEQEPERIIEVAWDVASGQEFLVKLAIVAEDRKNILVDITEAIANADANVRGAELLSQETAAVGNFVIEIKNRSHLDKVIAQVHKKVKGIIKIERAYSGEQDS